MNGRLPNPRLFLPGCSESSSFPLAGRNTEFSQTRTTAFILISTFLHALAFFAGGLPQYSCVVSLTPSGAFYLPLYYQILGASATGAGVKYA